MLREFDGNAHQETGGIDFDYDRANGPNWKRPRKALEDNQDLTQVTPVERNEAQGAGTVRLLRGAEGQRGERLGGRQTDG